MNSKDHFLKDNYTIASNDTDFMSKIRISSLVNFFIQSAWRHAEQLGVGFSHLSEMGLVWVLSRLTLKLESLPDWPGECTLTTWSKGMERLFYKRDAELIRPNHTPFAWITSAWLMIDKKSKRPKVYHPDWLTQYHHVNKHALSQSVPALETEGELASSTHYITRYSDIDVNQHLTTFRYIDLVFDTYDLEFIQKNQPKEIIVNFLREIAFGEEIIMYKYENGNTHDFELMNGSDCSICFRARIRY